MGWAGAGALLALSGLVWVVFAVPLGVGAFVIWGVDE